MTELEQWAKPAAQDLCWIVAEITRSDGHDRGTVELRAFLKECDEIRAGRPTWRARLAKPAHRDDLCILAFLGED
ncbi:hypothetical protein [Imhoffiella purpurea]|uniref:hypothetical protein n=1 Tax=Imhoffiella purpurea TaxID=1249627 RepID=UPI0005C14056|nr:hypothetical protein [Imhoffiella purpurea]